MDRMTLTERSCLFTFNICNIFKEILCFFIPQKLIIVVSSKPRWFILALQTTNTDPIFKEHFKDNSGNNWNVSRGFYANFVLSNGIRKLTAQEHGT